MRTPLTLVFLLLASLTPAFARQRLWGFCEIGNQTVTVNGFVSPNLVQGSYPQCTVTVYVSGSQSVKTANYVSGGTISGTVGQTITLFINGGVTGATATATLTGTNTIGTGAALIVNTPGAGYTGTPTTATCGSGTATCSGTITITSTVIGTIATIYADNNGTVLSNPFIASKQGVWYFYPDNGRYDVQMTLGIPNTMPAFTEGDVLANDSGGTTVGVSPPQFATGASTCLGKGEDDTPCLMAMHDALFAQQTAAIAAGSKISFKITFPAGGTFRYWNNHWLWGLKNVVVDFSGSSIQNTCLVGSCGGNNPALHVLADPLVIGRTLWCNTQPITVWFCSSQYQTLGYLINTMQPGAYTGNTVTASDLSTGGFVVGQWVMVMSYDQQFGGFPPNCRYFDWAHITAINTSTGAFTLDTPVSHLHSATYPELSSVTTSLGRARIFNIDRPDVPFMESVELDNMNVLPSLYAYPNPTSALTPSEMVVQTDGVYKINVHNSNIISWGVTAGNKEANVYDSYVHYTQPDKEIDHVSFTNTILDIASSSAGVNNFEFKGGSIGTSAYFNARNVVYNNTILKGIVAPPVPPGESPYTLSQAISPSASNPSKVAVNNSLILGDGSNNKTPFGIASATVPLVIDGSNVTLTNNYTLQGPLTDANTQRFFSCIEVGNPVTVTPTTPDGLGRWGTVMQVYGGTTAAKADINFNTPVSNGWTVACYPTTDFSAKDNTYLNFNFHPGVGATYPWPSFPRTNIENQVTNDGRSYDFHLDSYGETYGVYNINGYVTNLIITVDRPYTGSESTPTIQIQGYPGGANTSMQAEIVNLAVVGRRDIGMTSSNPGIGSISNPTGLTYTGTSGCTITTTGGGGTGATFFSQVLSGVPTLPFTVVTTGSGYTSTPTTGTVSGGGCSGTPTFTSTLTNGWQTGDTLKPFGYARWTPGIYFTWCSSLGCTRNMATTSPSQSGQVHVQFTVTNPYSTN